MENALRETDEDLSNVDKLNNMKSRAVELNNTRLQLATMLKQKSRNKWLVEGASNTSFFHNSIRIRRSSNTISELVNENGETITNVDQMVQHVVSFNEDKFNGDSSVLDDSLFDIDHSTISAEESIGMDLIPMYEEIREAIFSLGADSSPGPDGFAVFFYRHCWDIISSDLVKAIIFCLEHKYIPHKVNSSLLMLLPKVRGANTLSNFCPIGLSNFFFKIFTKILATRLGTVLGNLVPEKQVASMKGRNIHENISLAPEMVNELQIKRKDGNVGLKLDITQAFDTVSWKFIMEVFRRYGFSEGWCTWILHILQSTRISVLFNGSPEGFFKIDRGLFQGDPLSPLIFVLIEDVLSRNIAKLFRDRKMTHMVTRKGNMKSLQNLVDLLGSYQRASGQTVSRQKSKLYYGGGSLSRRTSISTFLGMKVVSFPYRYLGIKIMPEIVRYHHISNVVEKIKEKLSGWKGKHLSFQDRVVLIKFVIVSYSIHNMAVYRWPKKIVHQCEVVIQNFLWTGDSSVRRSFTVAYDKVCVPYEEGGLGISSMISMNKALLMKLWWNMKTSKKNWAKLFRARFFSRNGHLRKYIKSSILPGIKWVYNDVENNVHVLIGDGRATSLYFDAWCSESSIADVLDNPNLDRSVLVSDMLDNGNWALTDPCIANMLAAGGDVNNLPRPMGGENYRVCKPSYKGDFMVKSAKDLVRVRYAKLEGANLIWRPEIHPSLASQNWKFLVCVWHQNASKFDNSVQRSQRVIHRKIKQIEPVECFWEPPEADELMICCDSASRGNPGVAGGGVVVRDTSSNVLGAMNIGLGTTTNYLAEVFAVIVGLEWAMKFGLQRICIRSDSMAAMQTFSGGVSNVPWFIRSRWVVVKRNYARIRFVHSFRETNFSADTMAKRGCFLQEKEGMNYDGRPDFLHLIELPNVFVSFLGFSALFLTS
ncbi:uncharacterized protein LOC113342272 [Papaver somniferum]|uniref:uncharacterized protein LOC113342272 n=1 Tax=Papaver somniferum TaxID=3469 RepID=UPI000E6FEF90|nr:uncharacterized protein LOC113342272 [Papaver somniferum]